MIFRPRYCVIPMKPRNSHHPMSLTVRTFGTSVLPMLSLPEPSQDGDLVACNNHQPQGELVIDTCKKLNTVGLGVDSEAWLASLGPEPPEIEGRFTYKTMSDICKVSPEMQDPLKEIVKFNAEIEVCLSAYIVLMCANLWCDRHPEESLDPHSSFGTVQ